ncbi:hypothetical protein TNCV_1364641 [Trichonephila clavipes]|nr:hypothetical protein TNCV_1364641 [Trichonephila clavipes]
MISTANEVCVRVVRLVLKSRERVFDNPRSGRQATSVSDEHIEKARQLIDKDHLLTARMIADQLYINHESASKRDEDFKLHPKRLLVKFPGHM